MLSGRWTVHREFTKQHDEASLLELRELVDEGLEAFEDKEAADKAALKKAQLEGYNELRAERKRKAGEEAEAEEERAVKREELKRQAKRLKEEQERKGG